MPEEPEEDHYSSVTVTANIEIMKKPSQVRVLSAGIGDSDGFPVFEEDADRFSVPKDRKWGFRITGGAEFHMPLTVFQVSEDSLAEKGGIRLGDIILEINGIDATKLTLAKAHEIIDMAYLDLNLVAQNMDDEEDLEDGNKDGPSEGVDNMKGEKRVKGRRSEPRAVELKVPVLKAPSPPREFVPTPLLERRIWKPVLWQEPESKNEANSQKSKDPPHSRLLNNIRRFFAETEDKPELRKKVIEDMLVALPPHIQRRLREMQRKLSEIAEIPIILQSTLQAVSKTFDHIIPSVPNTEIPYNDECDDNYDQESGTQDDMTTDSDEDDISEPDSLEEIVTKKKKAETPESDYVSEENENDGNEIMTNFVKEVPELTSSDSEMEHEDQLEDEEAIKTEKQEKMHALERSWPWADRQKVIYKQSTCHLVPKLSIVESRVKQFGEQNVFLCGRTSSTSTSK